MHKFPKYKYTFILQADFSKHCYAQDNWVSVTELLGCDVSQTSLLGGTLSPVLGKCTPTFLPPWCSLDDHRINLKEYTKFVQFLPKA